MQNDGSSKKLVNEHVHKKSCLASTLDLQDLVKLLFVAGTTIL